MSKSRFSNEAVEVFARYTIDEGALSRAYDDAFKRAFVQSRESDAPAARAKAKEIESQLARSRDNLDRLVQELGSRFAASEDGMTETLAKVRTQGEAIAALVREGERGVATGTASSTSLASLKLHEAWSRTIKHHLKDSGAHARSGHRLLLEACAYAFTCVAKDGDRMEGYAFVLKSVARLTADFAQCLLLLPLAANLRELCCRIDQRLKGAGDALHGEALELYCELTELTLEQLASE